jgi:hypothetical protein
MTATRNGGIFRFQAMTTKPDINIHNTESQVVFTISEYRVVAMYSETELQVLTKQLKQLKKIEYIITREQ